MTTATTDSTKTVYVPRAIRGPSTNIWITGVYANCNIEYFNVDVDNIVSPEDLLLQMYCLYKAVSIDYGGPRNIVTCNSKAVLMVNACIRRAKQANSSTCIATTPGIVPDILRSIVDIILEKERNGMEINISSASDSYPAIIEATQVLLATTGSNENTG